MAPHAARGRSSSTLHPPNHCFPLLHQLPPPAGKRQFAAVGGGLLAWDFELKDERGCALALIDR